MKVAGPAARAVLALLVLPVGHTAQAAVREGERAPLAGIAGVTDVEGRPADLSRLALAPDTASAEAPGRATLLVFWASWCHPCINEIPVLNELRRFYGKRGLRILGLGVREGGETLERLKGAAAGNGASYPILYDGEGKAQEAFDVHALPMSVLIDAEGLVRWIGPALPTDVAARVEAALVPGERRGAK